MQEAIEEANSYNNNRTHGNRRMSYYYLDIPDTPRQLVLLLAV